MSDFSLLFSLFLPLPHSVRVCVRVCVPRAPPTAPTTASPSPSPRPSTLSRARLVRSLTPPSLPRPAPAAWPGLSPPRHPVYARVRREAALPLDVDARAEAAYCQRVADEDALCRLLDAALPATAPRLLYSLSSSALRSARKHGAAACAGVSPLAPRLPRPPGQAPARPHPVPAPAPAAAPVPTEAAVSQPLQPPPRSSSAPPLPWDDMT